MQANGRSAPWTEHSVLSELKLIGNMRVGNMNSLSEQECVEFRSALLNKIAPGTVEGTKFMNNPGTWDTKQVPGGCQFVQNLQTSENDDDFEAGVNTVLGWDIVCSIVQRAQGRKWRPRSTTRTVSARTETVTLFFILFQE